MAKRRRRASRRSILNYFDWSINPDTLREAAAALLVVVGLVGVLALFGFGGAVGQSLTHFAARLFGVVHYLVPVAVSGVGVALWDPSRFTVRWSLVIGLALLFFFLPGLLEPFGGILGTAVHGLTVSLLGELAGALVLGAIVFISLLLILNTSLRQLTQWLLTSKSEEPQIHEAGAAPAVEPRVSVFTLIKQKLGAAGPESVGPVPVSSLPGAGTSGGKMPAALSVTNWQFPPLDLLSLPTGKAKAGDVVKNVELIEKTLRNFGIEVAMGDVNIGPTVTQYTLKPTEGIKLTSITARANDLALALAAPSIRIEAPIPGKALVGVEVPNKVPAAVTLREVIETDQFKATKSHLSLALGRDAAGAAIAVDLKKMPHLLIAGATGSGKSIAINSLLGSLLYQNTPAQLKLLLIDPKRVEFTLYNGIPHLLAPVITEPDKTVNTLKWAIVEMERRYQQLQDVGSRDITGYNQKNKGAPMPYIVIVIDELADLMAQSAKEVEASIVRLAQMARAVGIHLIVATQRPSVDVITGLIKANITTRMAFAVASQVDSRTIIDIGGAEKLLGNGDMLYLSADFIGKPRRVQGCLITEKEVAAVSDWLRSQGPAQYDEEVMNFAPRGLGMGGSGGEGLGDSDALFEEAKDVVMAAGKASASLLQRRLRVGYARAARLLDILEEHGVIGPADGSKPRDVLVGFDAPGSGTGGYQTPPPPTQPPPGY